MVVQGVLVGALALTTALGFGMGDAAASTATGANCDVNAAMYAADRWRAANRSGDTFSAKCWWSIYEHNELSYVRAGCLGGGTAT